MASKSFTQNSSGKTFEEKSNGVTDLSSLADGSLLAHESMAGGNLISAKKGSLQEAAPGSISEQTDTNVLGTNLDANHVPDPAAAPAKSHRKEVH